jgi:hypothetical protein
MHWFTMIIPAILCAILLIVPSFRRKTVWWELAIPAVVTIIAVIICQFVAIRNAISDKEYWGHMAVNAVHEEPYSYDSQCTESYMCGTDSEGHIKYCTRYVHCVKKSGRKCYFINDKGDPYRISYAKYKEVSKRWNNNEHVESIIITHSEGYTTKGDKYKRAGHGHKHVIKWPKTWKTAEPMAEVHTYENRLQTQSHWGEVSEEDIKFYDLLDYNFVEAGYEAPAILSNGPKFRQADEYMRYLNGYLNTTMGKYKKVRLWILVFQNQPRMAAEYQRKYWKGGNKNELTVMFGIDRNNIINWCDIMTWSKSDKLTIEIRDHINLEMMEAKNGYSGQLGPEEMLRFTKWLGDAVETQYVKPDFDEFNYIDVQPSGFAIILTWIIVLLVNIGAGLFVFYNSWHDN